MATTIPAELPTEAEVEKLYELLQNSHDAAERLVWRVDRFLDPDIAERPTLADLGLLWLLVEQLSINGAEMRRMSKRVEQLMSAVDSKRIDPLGGDDA